jgi:uncharacterized cupin superfamily protein
MRETNRPRPSFIVSSSALPEEPGQYPNSDEVLSFTRRLGRTAGLQRIGVNLERLPAGHRTSWPHAEGDEEEFVYVISGEVDAWVNGDLHRMSAGDFAAFPAGTGISHTFINNSQSEALLLVGGERSKQGNRIFYPHHPHRREELKAGEWWTDVPTQEMGAHDGLPGQSGDRK